MLAENITGAVNDLAVADLNGDGVPEALASVGEGLVLFTRAGADKLEQLAQLPSRADRLALADLNGDSRPELSAIENGKVVRFELLNNLARLDPCPGESGAVTALHVADLDNDSHKDLVIGLTAGQAGCVRFGQGPTAQSPAPNFGAWLGLGGAGPTCDIDSANLLGGDSDELVLATLGGTLVYRDIAPKALAPSIPPLQPMLAIDAYDSGGQILVGRSKAAILVFQPDGETLTLALSLDVPSADAAAVAVANLGGDNSPELVVGSDITNTLLLRPTKANAYALEEATTLTANPAPLLTLAGLTGNEPREIVLAGPSQPLTVITLSQELEPTSFALVPTNAPGLPAAAPKALAAGDLNDDGKGDLVVIFDGLGPWVLYGKGDLSFVAVPITGVLEPITAVAVADLDDKKGDELLFGQSDGSVLLGNSLSLRLSPPYQELPLAAEAEAQPFVQVAVGDLDADGDMDLVIGRSGGRFVVYSGLPTTSGATKVSFEETAQTFGTDTGSLQALDLADLDGDGRLDVLLRDYQGYLRPYCNSTDTQSGTPRLKFSELAQPINLRGDLERSVNGRPFVTQLNVLKPSDVAIADFNNDGRLDFALSYRYFTIPFFPFSRYPEQSRFNVQLLEQNQGSNPCANIMMPDSLASNSAFQDIPTPISGSIDLLAAGQIDGSGGLDLVVGRPTALFQANQRFEVWTNGGAGLFQPICPPRVPTGPRYCLEDTSGASGLSLGDVDGEGGLDIVTNRHVLFAPLGSTAPVTHTLVSGLPSRRDPVLGDLNADGRLDIVTPEAILLQEPARSFFAEAEIDCRTNPPALVRCLGHPSTIDFLTADMDGDADLDVVSINRTGPSIVVYHNSGAGRRDTLARALLDGTATFFTPRMLSADFTGDGQDDVLLADNGPDLAKPGQGVLIAANQGSPFSTTAKASFSTVPEPIAIVAGDLNGDAQLDAVVVDAYGRVGVHLNQGDGNFGAATSGLESKPGANVWGAALGDLDGDEDLDLAVAGGFGQSLIYYNRGGTEPYFLGALPRTEQGEAINCKQLGPDTAFTVSCLGGPGEQITSLAAADMDGDGDTDLVAARVGAPGAILRNNRGAGFAELPSCVGADAARRCFGDALNKDAVLVAVADMNRDKRPDIVTTAQPGSARVFLADAQGEFALAQSAGARVSCEAHPQTVRCFGSPVETITQLLLVDFDQDTDLDIVTGSDERLVAIHLNNGDGTLSASRLVETTGRVWGLTAGNLDDQEGMELVVSDGSNWYWSGRPPGLQGLADGAAQLRLGAPPCPSPRGACFAEGSAITFNLTIADPEGDPVKVANLRARYSLDGGGTWQQAMFKITDQAGNPPTDNHLATSQAGIAYKLVWDNTASLGRATRPSCGWS